MEPLEVEPNQMNAKEITEKIKDRFSDEVIDITEFRDQFTVSLKPDRIVEICRYLHDDPDIYMDYLADLCGVDYPEREDRFEVVYNLFSIKHGHRVRIKALLRGDKPSVDSVMPVWKGADWHEREASDMYGINFKGHPDLRRILMPEDWEGYPLRKDYPLKGPEDYEYEEFEKLKELHTHDDDWTIK